jgi:hypothetical protein
MKQRMASALNRWTSSIMTIQRSKMDRSIWVNLETIGPCSRDRYNGIQRQVNDRNKPEWNKYRTPLAEAFSQAVQLRGGGSASGQLLTFAPAHEELIIARI